MPKFLAQLNVRVSTEIHEKVEDLLKHYENKTEVIVRAIEMLHESHTGLKAEVPRGKPISEKQTKGVRGRPPYGYMWENKGTPRARLVEDQEEQVVLSRLLALRHEGFSMSEVAERVNRDGHVTRSGGSWTKQTAHKVLTTHDRNLLV